MYCFKLLTFTLALSAAALVMDHSRANVDSSALRYPPAARSTATPRTWSAA